LAVGSAWALAAYLQYPDVIDFWKHDYGGRVNQGYMKEAPWYYFLQWPYVTFPWTPLIVLGFVAAWRRSVPVVESALADGERLNGSPGRFLWCWGLVPILFFSIPQGKHHHYLLQTMAPWAILGALGARRVCEWLTGRVAWVQRPRMWLAAVCAALVA